MYQLDANNFTMIFSHKWPLHVSDIYMSIFKCELYALKIHIKHEIPSLLVKCDTTQIHRNI